MGVGVLLVLSAGSPASVRHIETGWRPNCAMNLGYIAVYKRVRVSLARVTCQF
jgi:hypothetical protein